jgi:hypothetical protein
MHIIVEHYRAAPACCMLCRGDKTPAIDFQREHDPSFGIAEALYLCRDCIRDLAKDITEKYPALGFRILRAEQLAAYDERMIELTEENETLRERLESADTALAALTRVMSYDSPVPVTDPSVSELASAAAVFSPSRKKATK